MAGLDPAIHELQHLVATDKSSFLRGYGAMRLTTSLLAFTILSALAGRADASGEIDIFESGANVVAAGAGVFDITDLTVDPGSSGSGAAVSPLRGTVVIGSAAGSVFYGFLSGPSSLGSGRFPTFASSESGDGFGTAVVDERDLLIPSDYVSGAALLGSAMFDDQTIASLGLDPGTYVYTWGSGDHADSLTIKIGGIGTVPELSTWAMMGLGFAALGLTGYRASRRSAAAA
jgi:hypothetical protein